MLKQIIVKHFAHYEAIFDLASPPSIFGLFSPYNHEGMFNPLLAFWALISQHTSNCSHLRDLHWQHTTGMTTDTATKDRVGLSNGDVYFKDVMKLWVMRNSQWRVLLVIIVKSDIGTKVQALLLSPQKALKT